MFRRTATPEQHELRAAKKALANDPVNTGALGDVDENSPAAHRNAAAQERVRAAETAIKNKR